MTIQELKERIAMLDVAESYCDLKKSGKCYMAKVNPLREENTSSLAIYPDTQTWYDFGNGGKGGDIIDFIEKIENLSQTEAKAFLAQKYLGTDITSKNVKAHEYRHIPKLKKPEETEKTIEEENALIEKLELKAQKYLSALPVKKWTNFLLEDEISGKSQYVISVASVFEELFQGGTIPAKQEFAKYLFEKFIGFDSYFNCPVIIIRDRYERVVDIVRYKPERNGKKLSSKYLSVGDKC